MEGNKHAKFEFSRITEQIFLGTNLCCLVTSHIQILLGLGVFADIDLEEERQNAAPAVPVYLWLPVVDHGAPVCEQIDAGVALMDSMIKRGKKIYVHCRNGHGRSPTLVAAYFIYKGKTVEKAIEAIKVKRPEIHLREVQVVALEDYFTSLNG